jgi:hypothetical protein
MPELAARTTPAAGGPTISRDAAQRRNDPSEKIALSERNFAALVPLAIEAIVALYNFVQPCKGASYDGEG